MARPPETGSLASALHPGSASWLNLINRWWGLHPHHLVHVADGGDTSTTNGAWLCTTHHHLVHEGGWTVTGQPDHTLWFHPPAGHEHRVQRAFSGHVGGSSP